MALGSNDITLISQIVATIIGGLIAGLVGFATSNSMEERRRKWEKLQQKKQIRSKLLGEQFFVANIYYQRGYSNINKTFYQLLIKSGLSFKEAAPEKSFDVNECFRFVSKDEIKDEISNNRKLAEKEMDCIRKNASDWGIASKELWEIIGLIQVSFDNTIDERDKLVMELETAISDYNKITFNPSETESRDPYGWSKNKHAEIEKCLDDEITPAFENLLDFLKSEIDKDKEDLEKIDNSTNHRCYKVCKFHCDP